MIHKKKLKVEYTPKFKIEDVVKTTVYMSEEDIGEEVQVGTQCTIVTEPVDDEQPVGVSLNGPLHYLPQDALETN